MNNVIPIRKCGRCGTQLGSPRKLVLKDEVIAAFNACSECIEKVDNDLAQVAPIFEAMLKCGVDREIASDTMTFLLNRMHP